ncbi:MAG: hypothetical protein Q9190_000732 [Brigantiaea leucoxantha]
MLRDEDFSSRAKVDRYGRSLPKDMGRKELQRYYRIEGNISNEDEEDERAQSALRQVKAQAGSEIDSTSNDSSSDDETMSEEDLDGMFGLPDQHGEGANSVPTGKVTSRIAVVNLDWDNIRAADLMAVFSSFISSSGRIRRISVYPSEFGKARMEREEMEGPPKEIFMQDKKNVHGRSGESDLEEEHEGGSNFEDKEEDKIKESMLQEDLDHEFNSAKLRRYQLERLRYYYAVIICSSPSIAQAIYEAVDGTEYLTTANFFDLRFIPDDVDFSEDKPRDECERIPDGYRPNDFVTDALQHSKVKLTWDADDGTRKEAQKRAFRGSRAEIDENDLKAYLASDSSEDEGRAPEPLIIDATTDDLPTSEPIAVTEPLPPKQSKKEIERQRMRALLGLSAESRTAKKTKASTDKSPVGNIQVTFSSGLSSNTKNNPVFGDSPERDETTVEKYVRKEKERKARRREKRKADTNGVEPTKTKHNLEENSTRNLAPAPNEEITQDLGFDDPFFTGSTVTEKQTSSQRKQSKRLKRSAREAEEATSAAQRAELELLMMDDQRLPQQQQQQGDDHHDSNQQRLNHFDMNAIVKAEKALAKKKRKKHRTSERENEALEMKAKDEFRMDVRDPRFGAVFERAEYAIDPSHPKYLGTEGMRELLEEGRRRRRVVNGDEDNIEDEGKGREMKRRKGVETGEEEEVQRLVERVKGRAK